MTPLADPERVLVVQTAFLGDVILTLPLIRSLKMSYPAAEIDVLVVPKTSEVLRNNPSIRSVMLFDKRGTDAGIGGFIREIRKIRKEKYDLAFLPHRSLRSTALVRLAGIPRRIGFHPSAGRFLLTDVIEYESSAHEIDRNLNLLRALDLQPPRPQYPDLYPSGADRVAVDHLLRACGLDGRERLVGIAPGTVWNTKRWPPDRFADLAGRLLAGGFRPVILGGQEDASLLSPYLSRESASRLVVAAGQLSILQSAELIRRCRALVCNDSAPMHLAVAVRTPVVAIFGATIPQFGFAPVGENDIVLETMGLPCRPCSKHGGNVCPVKTFDCMMNIPPLRVFEAVNRILQGV